MTQKRRRRVVGVPEMLTRVLSRKIANISPREILTSFRPVVTSTILSKDVDVRAEQTSKRTTLYRIHSSGLKVDQDRTGNILVGTDFIVVNVDTLKLEVVCTRVQTVAVDAVFI